VELFKRIRISGLVKSRCGLVKRSGSLGMDFEVSDAQARLTGLLSLPAACQSR
jgi:cytochrome c-type biogenesis protein CcmE